MKAYIQIYNHNIPWVFDLDRELKKSPVINLFAFTHAGTVVLH